MTSTSGKSDNKMAEVGRPRQFDRSEALVKAMRVFWSRGYEGASMQDLSEAMGVNKPSLYATFGCKEELFREAVSLYDATEGVHVTRSLDDAPTAREAVETMLRANATAFTAPGNPRGCMVVLASLLGAPENEGVRAFLADNRLAGEKALKARLDRGLAEGDLPTVADTAQLAAFFTTVLEGLSIQARDGASDEKLGRIVEAALLVWPRG